MGTKELERMQACMDDGDAFGDDDFDVDDLQVCTQYRAVPS